MAQKKEYLSKNQKIVLDIIEKSAQPMKAYSILFNVQKKGLKAPPQVLSLIHISEPTRPR